MFFSIYKFKSNRVIILIMLFLQIPHLTFPDTDRLEAKCVMQEITAFNFASSDERIEMMKAEDPDLLYPSFLELYKFYWRYLLSPYDLEAVDEFKRKIALSIKICSLDEYLGNTDAELFKMCSYIFRAAVEYQNGDLLLSYIWIDKVRKMINSISQDSPMNGDLNFIKGCIDYYALGRNVDLSLLRFKSAVSNGFFFKDMALMMTADIYKTNMKDFEKSFEIYSQLLSIYPENSLINFYFAKGLQHLGYFNDSLAAFEKTLETISYNPMPLELLCKTHFSEAQIYEKELRDFQMAVRKYEYALNTADPSVEQTIWFIPWSSLHLGLVLSGMGEKEKALYYLNKIKFTDDPEAYMRARIIIDNLSDQ